MHDTLTPVFLPEGVPVALDPIQIRFLRGLAHDLDPIVMIGQKGISDSVRVELDQALARHELVKIRVTAEDRERRDRVIQELARETRSTLIQQIGHTATLYRRAEPPRLSLPGERPATTIQGSDPPPRNGQRQSQTRDPKAKQRDQSSSLASVRAKTRSEQPPTTAVRRTGRSLAGTKAGIVDQRKSLHRHGELGLLPRRADQLGGKSSKLAANGSPRPVRDDAGRDLRAVRSKAVCAKARTGESAPSRRSVSKSSNTSLRSKRARRDARRS